MSDHLNLGSLVVLFKTSSQRDIDSIKEAFAFELEHSLGQYVRLDEQPEIKLEVDLNKMEAEMRFMGYSFPTTKEAVEFKRDSVLEDVEILKSDNPHLEIEITP